MVLEVSVRVLMAEVLLASRTRSNQRVAEQRKACVKELTKQEWNKLPAQS